MESECKYVCSRGIMKSCDVYPIHPVSSIRQVYQYDWSTLQSGKVVYINTSAIPDFVQNHFQKIPISTRFVLVSGDADETTPDDIFASDTAFLKFIEDARILRWFSQNCVHSHPKLVKMPIGLDYHTLAGPTEHWWGPKASPKQQEQLVEAIIAKSKTITTIKTNIYCNFHFQMNTTHSYDRQEALKELPPKLLQFELEPQPRMKSWLRQVGCAFVASPHGGGYDCHRTWEALVLGCIPIVKSSKLDSIYEGLPVLVVKRWRDINEKLLNDTMKNFSKRTFEFEKLTLAYWVGLIRNEAKYVPSVSE